MKPGKPQLGDGDTASRHLNIWPLLVVLALGFYLLLTSAFYPLGFLSVFDAKRALQLVLFVALLLFAILYTPLRKASIEQLVHIPVSIVVTIILFLIIGFVSSLRLTHPAYALIDVSMIAVMFILVFITAASRNIAGQNFDRWAVSLLAVMGFMVAFQEFMGYLVGWNMGAEFSYEQMLVHFANPRFFNQLQTWSIPILAALPLLFPQRRWIKTLCICLLGLQWFLIFSTGARGSFLSLLTAMVFIFFWLPKSRHCWFKLQMAGVLAGMAVYVIIMLLNNAFIPQSGQFFEHSVGRPMMHTSGRSLLWRLSVEDAIQNPVLGAGPTRYACDSPHILPAHPHSFPLRILGEWGFIALILLIFLAGSIGLGFLKKLKGQEYETVESDSIDTPLRAMLGISVIAAVMHACLSGLLIMPASQVTMILIAGWCLSLAQSPVQKENVKPIVGLVLMIGLVFAVTQLTFISREIPVMEERTGFSVEAVRMVPRFWWLGRACDYHYMEASD